MDFGIFNIMQQRHASKSPKDIIDQGVQLAMLAEQCGLSRAWFAEHHFSNYSLSPSPLMLAAHVAACTTSIRLGTAVVVAPLYEPARLLAEIGLVDNLSNGRLDLGIGSGYQGYEFDRFHVAIEDAAEITGEILELIEKALTSDSFSHSGKHFQLPTSSLNVRPVQKKLPIYYAGSHPDHLRWIARHDYPLMITGAVGGLTRMMKIRAQLEDAYVAEGKNPDDAKVVLSRLAFASHSRADVAEYLDCSRYQQRLAVTLKSRKEVVVDNYLIQEEPFEGEPDLEGLERNLPVGSPEVCAEKLLREIKALKPVHVMIQPQVGDMDFAKSTASLELFAREVVPLIEEQMGSVPSVPAARRMTA